MNIGNDYENDVRDEDDYNGPSHSINHQIAGNQT